MESSSGRRPRLQTGRDGRDEVRSSDSLLRRAAAGRCSTAGASRATATAAPEVHDLGAVGKCRALQRAAGLAALERPNRDLDLIAGLERALRPAAAAQEIRAHAL